MIEELVKETSEKRTLKTIISSLLFCVTFLPAVFATLLTFSANFP